MDKAMKDRCYNCRFFRKGDQTPMRGECHRRAPAPTYGYGVAGCAFPVVSIQSWCGEHEPKD